MTDVRHYYVSKGLNTDDGGDLISFGTLVFPVQTKSNGNREGDGTGRITDGVSL